MAGLIIVNHNRYFEQKVHSLTNSKYEPMEFESRNDYDTKRYSLIHQHTAIFHVRLFVSF